ncbi:hypothetical protein [Sphingomonas phyllosphaerae]|uniref:hypothetical protein n=1 Tax=Sphingomonas phyllosphaerae TaxID=257003 RepID=UPI00042737EF|nr:hypothetical protein [Sphingomonas phyllosphaerae]
MIPRKSAARGAAALLLATAAVTLPTTPLAAQETRFAVDVSAGAAYSTNPFLVRSGGESSVSTELSVVPQLNFVDERSQASLVARYRRSDYLTRYNSAEAYGFSALARRTMSSRLNLRADVSFDSSIIGQNGLGIVGVVNPNPVPGPDLSTPDITLIGLNQRQNAISAAVGGDYRLSTRDTINGQVSVNRISYGGNGGNGVLLSSRTTGATVGYSRSLSERLSVGAQGSGSWIDYDNPSYSGHTYSPQATVSYQASQLVNLSLGAGVVFVSSTTPRGTFTTTGFSGTFNGCRNGGRSVQCLRAYSDAQPTGLGDVSRRLGASFDYSYQVGEFDFLRASVEYSRLTTTSNTTLQAPRTSFLSGQATYERGLTRRLFAGASVGYRQADATGFGTPHDVTFRLFLRTRLGDIR